MPPTESIIQLDKIDERLPDHLTLNEKAALKKMVDRLYRRYGNDLRHVILFGSKARGDFDKNSDIDLFFVIDMDGEDYREYWHEVIDILWEIELEHDLVTTSLIRDKATFDAMSQEKPLLYRDIERDGILLWTIQTNDNISSSG